MSIELHIERLVLDEALLGGERAGDVRAALESEMTRLLSRPGAVDALRDMGDVAVLPPAPLPSTVHPHDRLAPRIAVAVQQSLGIPSVSHVAREGK